MSVCWFSKKRRQNIEPWVKPKLWERDLRSLTHSWCKHTKPVIYITSPHLMWLTKSLHLNLRVSRGCIMRKGFDEQIAAPSHDSTITVQVFSDRNEIHELNLEQVKTKRKNQCIWDALKKKLRNLDAIKTFWTLLEKLHLSVFHPICICCWSCLKPSSKQCHIKQEWVEQEPG